MEILGIGPSEFLFIIVILLLVLGPTDLVQLGQKAGRAIRKIRRSETWIVMTNLARALRNLPATLADEVGADEILRDIVPDKGQRTIGNISMEGAVERRPDPNMIRPPAEQRFSDWTNAAPPEPTAEDAADAAEAEPPDNAQQ